MSTPKIRTMHVMPSNDGRFFVRIKSKNGLIVGDLSQMYANKREATRAAVAMCSAKLVLATKAPDKKAAPRKESNFIPVAMTARGSK